MAQGLQHGNSRVHPLGKRIVTGLLIPGILAVIWPLGGCGQGQTSVSLSQLNPGEQLYITRVVTLERAKAVALVQRSRGEALLDSLRYAWGDSALTQTLAGIPTNPTRARLVNELLGRILVAEKDSLLRAPRPDRLRAPLPDPPHTQH